MTAKTKAVATKADIAPITDDPFLNMMERVASNPDIDADKMQKILDMQMQVMDRAAMTEFFDAMHRVQAMLPTVATIARNQQTNSNYAKLDAISRAIKPIYTAEGFSTAFSEGKSDREGYIRILGVLRHCNGHKEDSYVDLPMDKTGIKGTVNKTDIHATGSTFTYGRRYLTCLMFDIATGDDTDGNAPIECISDKELADLEALIGEVEANPAQFLKYLKVAKLSDLPKRSFGRAVDALESKR